jgi:hypothetical protein
MVMLNQNRARKSWSLSRDQERDGGAVGRNHQSTDGAEMPAAYSCQRFEVDFRE